MGLRQEERGPDTPPENATLAGHTDGIGAITMNKKGKGKQTFVITGSADKTVKLW